MQRVGRSGRVQRGLRNGWALRGWEALEPRVLLTVTLDGLPTAYGNTLTVPAGKALIVPLTATNTLAGPVTYQVTASNPSLVPLVNAINPAVSAARTTIRMATSLGNMDFQLFNDVAPLTVARLLANLNSPDYTNSIFHRIIKDFVVQGGDRDGDGFDTTTTNLVEEEVDPRVLYANKGLLGQARTPVPGSGGSQFYITTGLARHLDFSYTIFGQLLRGWEVLDALNKVPTTGSGGSPADRPLNPPVLNSISVINDVTDAVLTLKSNSVTPLAGTITVTAKDAFGNQDVKVFNVATVADATNDPPFLPPPSTVDRVIPYNVFNMPVVWGPAVDIEGDPITIGGQFVSAPEGTNAGFNSDHTGLIITPPLGFSGQIQVRIYAMWSLNNDLQTSRVYTITVDNRTLVGDANNDGHVDLGDFDIWLNHAGSSTRTGAAVGDLDYSGIVDLGDFDIWFSRVGTSAAMTAAGPLAPMEQTQDAPLAAAASGSIAGPTLTGPAVTAPTVARASLQVAIQEAPLPGYTPANTFGVSDFLRYYVAPFSKERETASDELLQPTASLST